MQAFIRIVLPNSVLNNMISFARFLAITYSMHSKGMVCFVVLSVLCVRMPVGCHSH